MRRCLNDRFKVVTRVALYFKSIKKCYSLICKHVKMSADSHIYDDISGNFHLISHCYYDVIFDKKTFNSIPFKSESKPVMYDAVYEFCRHSEVLPTKENLNKFLSLLGDRFYVTFSEAAVILSIVKACCIEIVGKNIESGNEGQRSSVVSRQIAILRVLYNDTFPDIVERLCSAEKQLASDKIYANMDKRSKSEYRRLIQIAAQKNGVSETRIITAAKTKAAEYTVGVKSHFGYWLKNRKRYYYAEWCVALTIIFTALAVLVSNNVFICLPCVVPIWAICKSVLDLIYSYREGTGYLPRIELKNDIPKTLVCTVTVLKSVSDVDDVIGNIEKLAVTNKANGFLFGLLADLNRSNNKEEENDSVVVDYIKTKIEAIEKKYGRVFFVAIRSREYNQYSAIYEGRERKRGAICDFVKAISDNDYSKFAYYSGDMSAAEYLVTLDSDTQPAIDSIKKLVGVLEHPLSEPQLDSNGVTVTNGYGIAVPRIELKNSSFSENYFTRSFGGVGGGEVYSNPSFSTYQDLYGEGIFAGKGVIRISLFRKLLCDELPDNTVLSHDIVEGCYLRPVYVSDTVFYDVMPSNIFAYLKRAHRWIRGDVQNHYFLRKYRSKDGKRVNPLSVISKFKLFDNILRCIYPVALLSCFLFSVISRESAFIAAIALFMPFVQSVVKWLARPAVLRPVLVGSGLLSDVPRDCIHGLVSFMLLPCVAYNSADAIVRSMYRIAKRDNSKLLEWVTAAEANKDRLNVGTILRIAVPQILFGTIMVIFPEAVVLGIIWIIGTALPFAFCVRQRESKEKTSLLEIEGYLKDMWGWYTDFVTAEYNFLPPDNFQEDPLNTVVPRTSPTNIGLTAVALVGGYDMGYIDEVELQNRLSGLISSVEKLPKYKGNLFNWYDINKLTAISPSFVSFVDCGNFAVSMETLKNALKAFDKELFAPLVERVSKLLDEMDLSFLYDKDAGLFKIGYDVSNRAFTDGYYDLYASEALVSSYYCIAKGLVPVDHWERLERVVRERFGWAYVKSWSGTMFEYFMPTLFLPVSKYTFNDSMLKAAFCAQKTILSGLPWGKSESGYYLFDNNMFYQYKAFGVDKLAIKKEAVNDVTAPYATFLVLPFYPKAAIRNLRNYKNHSMYGEYGFYEALDSTPLRVGKDPTPVKSYMAHHISMSFISCVNFLRDNIMVHRFFQNNMSAFSELLEQRPPTMALVMTDVTGRYGRHFNMSVDNLPVSTSNNSNIWHAYSDGQILVIINGKGEGYTECGGVRLTRYRGSHGMESLDAKGIFAAIKSNGETLCLTPAPIFDKQVAYKAVSDLSGMIFRAKKRHIDASYKITVIPNTNCELRKVTLKNNSAARVDFETVIYFEPVITSEASEITHPAFSGLFVSSEFDSANNILSLYHRRSRETMRAISVTLFNAEGNEQLYECELSRFNVLSSGTGTSTFVNAFNIDMSEPSRVVAPPIDPCVCLRTQINLGPFETDSLYFVLSAGDSVADSAEKLKRLKKKTLVGAGEKLKNINSAYLSGINADRESIKLSDIILSKIMNPGNDVSQDIVFAPRENVFRYGVSGNIPFIFIFASYEAISGCLSFLKAFSILKNKCVPCEMIIGYPAEDEYVRPFYNGLKNMLAVTGLSSYVDRPNGLFLRSIRDSSDKSLLSTLSSFYVDIEKGWAVNDNQATDNDFCSLKVGRPIPIRYFYKTGVGGYALSGKTLGFGVDDAGKFPTMPPWCHLMANPRFGTIVSQSSLGCTFGANSVHERITPFSNDPVKGNDGEKLILKVGESLYDVVKGASSYYKKGSALYQTEIAGIRVKVHTFVSVNLPIKVIRVEFNNNTSGDVSLSLRCEADFDYITGKSLSVKYEDDSIIYTDPIKSNGRCVMLYSEGGVVEDNALMHTCRGGTSLSAIFYICLVSTKNRLNNLREMLAYGNFFSLERNSVEEYWGRTGTISIKTPDPCMDLLFNGFLSYQIKTSRLFAKTGFYQCSGAIGFRDQLQDTMALALASPQFLKKQIIDCCSKQFIEGDVLHWWHSVGSDGVIRGVRSRSSDDLMWLPLGVCEYVERVGSVSILNREVNYCDGRTLSDDENEAYIDTAIRAEKDTVYDHCKKAITTAVKRGKNGLILFGSGDWNDGMNLAGTMGIGETVWGSFFAVYVLEKFMVLSCRVDDNEFEQYCKSTSLSLRESIEARGWDGQWYRRGYHDSGKPMGAYVSEAGKIDILPQAFASICGGFDPGRVRRSLESVDKLLYDSENKLIKLLTPPYDHCVNKPGYIEDYVPGVRENGGQYTHAAVWYVIALIKDGQYEKAYDMLSVLNPLNRAKCLDDVKKYRVEPYVIAGDIYSAKGHEGMGGWTHYTGAAGWYHRAVIEYFFGIKIRGNRMSINPALPMEWREVRVEMNLGNSTLKLLIKKSRERKIIVDKVERDSIIIDGKNHEIVFQYLPV